MVTTRSLTNTLFDKTYHNTFNYMSDFTADVVLNIMKQYSITFESGTKMEEIYDKLSCIKTFIPHVQWAVNYLVQQNKIYEENGLYYAISSPVKNYDENYVQSDKLQPSVDLIERIGQYWPMIISGQKSPHHIIFGDSDAKLWEQYFSNNHYLYSIHNHWAAQKLVEKIDSQNKNILELGAGYGSGSKALLQELNKQNKQINSYSLTDISPHMLSKLNTNIVENFNSTNFEPNLLNIDKLNKVNDSSFDYVYAVNVLHCAKNPSHTISELVKKIKKGGTIIVSECVRGEEKELLHQEFMFSLLPGFNQLSENKDNPYFGFLTYKEWIEILYKAGITDFQMEINPGPKCLGTLILINT